MLDALKRIQVGDRLSEQIAARCIRELAHTIDDLNQRISALDQQVADTLAEHGNPSKISSGPATKSPPP